MTEIEKVPDAPIVASDPLAMIERLSTNPACNVETLERLMQMKMECDARTAQADWADAMRRFQETVPVIAKDKKADRYGYASYSRIMAIIGPALSECGLSLSFSSTQASNMMTTICTISHGTHSETSEFTCPVPKMSVSETQKYGAALSYAKRYCLTAALNLVIVDEDDETALASPHADADPHAAKAATRGTRDAVGKLFNRWIDATNGQPAAWWTWVAGTIGCVKAEADLTDEDLDKIAHAIGEIEGAGQ